MSLLLLAWPAWATPLEDTPYAQGQSFEALGMHTTAAYWFTEELKRCAQGPAASAALTELVGIAEETGDETDLRRLLTKVPAEAFPASLRDELLYQQGVRLQEQKKPTEALAALAGVGEQSHRYSQAKLLEGEILAERGEPDAAIRAFTAADADDVTRMNLARVHYAREHFAEAHALYAQVPRSSPQWHRALFEDAWARYMNGDVAGAERNLRLLAARGAFFPEATVLQAIVLFTRVDYAAIAALSDRFEAEWRPVHEQMRAAVARYAPDQGAADPVELLHQNYGPHPGSDALPAPLRTTILRDREFAGLLRHLRQIEAEEALVDRQPAAWRASFAASTHTLLAAERARLERRAGLALLGEVAWQAAYLGILLQQAEVIHFEALTELSAPADVLVPRLRALRSQMPEPARAEATFRLAELLRDVGTPAERIALYEDALREAPGWKRAHEVTWQLALTLAENGDPDGANAKLTHLVETWPAASTAADANLLIGDYWFERRSFAPARDAYARAAAAPEDPRRVAYARYKLAWCAWALGNHPGAVTQLRDVLPSITDNPPLAEAAARELAKMEAAKD